MILPPTALTTREKGQRMEDIAAHFVEQHGCQIIERNFHCALGEIDLILTQDRSLIFAEVRSRRSTHYGSALDSVDGRKQKKIIRTAQYFIRMHPWAAHCDCRFDVIAITAPITQSPTPIQIEWIPNAFQL